MKFTSAGAAAICLICLSGAASAEGLVNDEKGALEFIVRDAEIARAKAETESAETKVETAVEAKTVRGTKARTAKARAKVEAAEAHAAEAHAADAKTGDAKTAPAIAAAPAATEPRADDPKAATAAVAPAKAEGLQAIVARHAAANGVPFALADAIIRVESRYNPRAAHAGNLGLMQIRHQTARGVGYSGGAGGLLDAETNARFGMKYLAQAYRLAGGDTCKTIMKYQSGHMSERMSGANRRYCAKVRTITARS